MDRIESGGHMYNYYNDINFLWLLLVAVVLSLLCAFVLMAGRSACAHPRDVTLSGWENKMDVDIKIAAPRGRLVAENDVTLVTPGNA